MLTVACDCSCALLVEVADDADAVAEAEAHLPGGGGSQSPGGRKGLLGARLKALRKVAGQIGGFQPEVSHPHLIPTRSSLNPHSILT